MKKLAIFAILIFAAVITIGCGGATELAWKNDNTNEVHDITWVSGGVDQMWNEGTNLSTASGSDTTEFKEVTKLSGHGECFDAVIGGGSRIIEYDKDGTLDSAITLADGSSETIVISTTVTK